MIPAEKIMVALDTQDPQKLQQLFNELKGHPVWVKVGMELFYSLGPQVIHEAKTHGFKVFLDLKLHDIPNTVEKSLLALSKLPVNMINIHAAGGKEMMKKAAQVLKSTATPPLLIAVTQLTSATDEEMNQEQGIPGSLLESVLRYAHLSLVSGCDGVVSSAKEVKAIKELCGSTFLTVTPGIRPKGSETQDQKRIATPQEALALGTDFMVIGRPITAHPQPRFALETILKG